MTTGDTELVDRLITAGMSGSAARSKGDLAQQAEQALTAAGVPREGRFTLFVPGRLEMLGKHTDYAGGRSIVAAVERGFVMVGRVRAAGDRRVQVIAAETGETAQTELDGAVPPRAGHWSNYAAAVVRRIARNFPDVQGGLDLAFASDLPRASGMSSSSAMITGFFLAFDHVNGLARRDVYRRHIVGLEQLAEYLGTIENGASYGSLAGDTGVGTSGGSEDHTAILCSRAGRLGQYAFYPTRFERGFDLPPAFTFVIACSGVVAEKAGQARDNYNRLSAMIRWIVEQWQAAHQQPATCLAEIVQQRETAVEDLHALIDREGGGPFPARRLHQRLDQFVDESERIIPAVGDLLGAGRIEEIRPWVEWSQANAAQLLGNQVPETVGLVQLAQSAGSVAASAFGAGFGGAVWALVRTAEAEAFVARWRSDYHERFPGRGADSCMFVTRPGDGACVVR